jgi:HEAT repeat protein
MQIRDFLPRPGGPCLLVGLALFVTAVGPGAVQAQPAPAVEELERALNELLPPSDMTEEYTKALADRAKRLKRLTDDASQLQSLGDMTQALLLQNWGDDKTSAITTAPESMKVDRDAREALLMRFRDAVKREIRAGQEARDPSLRAAVATFIGEYGASARSGFLGARRGNKLLIDDMPWFTEILADLAEKDKAPEVRAAAAGALAKLQSDPTKENTPRNDDLEVPVTLPVTVPALRSMIRDPDPMVRAAAVAALRDLLRSTRAPERSGYAISPPVEPARENLVEFGTQVARAAGQALAAGDRERQVRRLAAEALLQVASSLNSHLRTADILNVARIHNQLQPVADVLWEQTAALSRAARDPDADVRFTAIRALEEMGEVRLHWVHPELLPVPPIENKPAKPATPPRAEATPDELSNITLAYAAAVAQPARAGDEPAPLSDAIPALVDGLSDENLRNRLAAIDALETITARTGEQTLAQELGKEPVASAARALTRALSDRDRFVRWAAARTLGKMAPIDDAENGPRVTQGAVSGLARLLSDPDPDVRLRVAVALEHFGKGARDAVPALAVAVSRGDLEARIAAAHAIEIIGGSPDQAVPALAAGLTESNVRLRRAMAEALASYGADARAARPELTRALQDSDAEVRRLAADALLRIGARR